jgi:hypothetical protein
MPTNQPKRTTVTVGQLALVRSGRCGSATVIGVVPRTQSGYDLLCRELTVAQIREGLDLDQDTAVRRNELPELWALSFVIEGVRNSAAASLRTSNKTRETVPLQRQTCSHDHVLFDVLKFDREDELLSLAVLDIELVRMVNQTVS